MSQEMYRDWIGGIGNSTRNRGKNSGAEATSISGVLCSILLNRSYFLKEMVVLIYVI